ncbi:MAG: YqgQ family protein, partial [Novibacillus thermophilus]
MQTVHDVRKFLQRYGTLIYTGDRQGDLDLMEDELRELYSEWGLISAEEFRSA